MYQYILQYILISNTCYIQYIYIKYMFLIKVHVITNSWKVCYFLLAFFMNVLT